MAYIPPQLDESPSGLEDPKPKASHFAHLRDILMIGAAVGLVGFLAALITAIVTD